MLFVHEHVCRPGYPLSPSARLVALLIAKRMGKDDNGADVAFMGEQDLAERSGLSARTVRRAMREVVHSGLFKIQRGGVTRGHNHRCRKFELVR